MAMTLGFIVVFIAGVAGAYFAGLQAARCRMPAAPAPAHSAKRSDDESSADWEDPGDDASATESVTLNGETVTLGGDPLTADADATEVIESEGFDTRRFKRLAFSGTAAATIYPPEGKTGSQPIRCEVLTRDLSCGGIGIAHTERLVPQQVIVLDAVGKLLVSEVRWCRRVDKDFYVAGCRLIKTKA